MKNYTDLTLIIDRSGSMQSISNDMEGGFSTFLAEQKASGDDIKVSVVYFDSQYEISFTEKDIKDVDGIKIIPRGSTALFDAIGKTINLTGERLSKLNESERPNRVLIYTITDGEENSSVEYASEAVKRLVQHQRDVYSWDFVFLGADIDSFSVGNSLGIGASSSANFTRSSAGVKGMWAQTTSDFDTYKKLDRSIDTTSTYCSTVSETTT